MNVFETWMRRHSSTPLPMLLSGQNSPVQSTFIKEVCKAVDKSTGTNKTKSDYFCYQVLTHGGFILVKLFFLKPRKVIQNSHHHKVFWQSGEHETLLRIVILWLRNQEVNLEPGNFSKLFQFSWNTNFHNSWTEYVLSLFSLSSHIIYICEQAMHNSQVTNLRNYSCVQLQCGQTRDFYFFQSFYCAKGDGHVSVCDAYCVR